MCTVLGICHTPGMAFTCSQDVGAACPPSGMCPWHVEHTPDASDARLGCALSWACATCPGRLLHVPRMWGQHAHHLARVPGMWNTPLMHHMRTHTLRYVIN